MTVTETPGGLRLSQHGVVISELRTSAGPTHSVFDLLAALLVELAPAGRVGMLGFAGGGMMAPLRALGFDRELEAVDLDGASHDLFRKHCAEWASQVRWHHGDASAWLKDQRPDFDLILEDLSVPEAGDVFKPAISWEVLPTVIRQRLKPQGVAVFNLLLSPGQNWRGQERKIAEHFGEARVLELEAFENRLLVAGKQLPASAQLSRRVGSALRRMKSRQAERFRVRTWAATH